MTHRTGEATGKQALSYLAEGSVNWYSPAEGSLLTSAIL